MDQQIDQAQIIALASDIKARYSPEVLAKLARMIEPVAPTGEMSTERFEELMQDLAATSKHRGYSKRSIEAARLVLVMGAGVEEAATETGLSRQAVRQLMARIRHRIEALPRGWVRVDQWLPADVAKQVDQMAQELRVSSQGEKTSFTINHQK